MPGNFRLCFESKSGYVKGIIPSPIDLSSAPSYGDPVLSDTGFVVWQPHSFDNAGVGLIWEQYYKPGERNFRGQNTLTGLLGLLEIDHATSEATAIVLAELILRDQYNNPINSPSLCLMGYRDNNVVQYFPAKKEDTGGTITYTRLGANASVASSGTSDMMGVYLVAGLFAIGSTGTSYGIGLIYNEWWGGIMKQCEGNIFLTNEAGWLHMLGFEPDGKEYNPDMGPASEPGGYGPGGGGAIGGVGGPQPTFDFTSDPFTLSPLPPGISELGFINIYKCGIGALTALGATLFPDVSAATDVMTAITALSDSIWNSKLIDYVISIHMIPCNVAAGNDEDIKIGTRTLTGIQGARITSDYVEVNLGSLKVDEAYTSFADYTASRARLYLPFYGFIELKPEFWQSATLSIKYRFNVVDGSFIATVTSHVNRHQPDFDALVGQYSGTACIHCPASGVSYASMFGGMISNSAGLGVSMASGNVAGVASSAINLAQTSQGNMEHSNAYNASASVMGHRTPFLLIERPVSQLPTSYGAEDGYPLAVTKRIGACTGLTICDNPVLNFGCSEEEGKAIIAALKEGVIV